MQSQVCKNISVVVPMYNEVDNAEPLVTEIVAALQDKLPYECIVVDDGSNDGTYERLQLLQQQYPHLRVIRHRSNSGQSAGLVTGIKVAKYDWIVTLDGDGQNNPADIPTLMNALSQSSDAILIAGNRAKRNDNSLRLLSSRIANGVRGWLLKDNCPDTGCGLKLFSRQAFLELPHFNHIHRFLPALFRRAGGKVINVPVSHRPRLCGQSKYGVMNRLWVGITDLFGVMWLIRRPCQAEIEDASN